MSRCDLVGLGLDEARLLCADRAIRINSITRTGPPGEQWRVVRQRSTNEGVDLVVATRIISS